MSATLAGKKLGCFNIFLVLADRLINLAGKIHNLSATLAGKKSELCLALITRAITPGRYNIFKTSRAVVSSPLLVLTSKPG